MCPGLLSTYKGDTQRRSDTYVTLYNSHMMLVSAKMASSIPGASSAYSSLDLGFGETAVKVNLSGVLSTPLDDAGICEDKEWYIPTVSKLSNHSLVKYAFVNASSKNRVLITFYVFEKMMVKVY